MKESAGGYKSFIHKIDRNNNIGLVRYFLAFSVVGMHFNLLFSTDIPLILTTNDPVGGFFTFSGFLLMYPLLSGEKFGRFFSKRAWRLLPSYFFTVLFFALLLSIFSKFSVGEYFGNKGFYEYLLANLSFLNFLHPELPGVFVDMKTSAVNGSLWTMKVEWQLTFTIWIFIWLIKKYRLDLRKSIVVLLIISLAYRFLLYLMSVNSGKEIYEILERQFVGQALFFFSGALLFTFYEELKSRKTLFIIVSLTLYIIFRCVDFYPFYNYLLHPFVLSLLVMSLSLIPGKIADKIDCGNHISYEIYLCHFPIMQIFGQMKLIEKIGVGATFALTIVAVVVTAILIYATVGRLYKWRQKKQPALNGPKETASA